MRTIICSGLLNGKGEVVANKSISFTLSTKSGVATSTFDKDTNELIAGTITATTDAQGQFTIDLWENDRGVDYTYYLVSFDDISYLVFLNTSPNTLNFYELVLVSRELNGTNSALLHNWIEEYLKPLVEELGIKVVADNIVNVNAVADNIDTLNAIEEELPVLVTISEKVDLFKDAQIAASEPTGYNTRIPDELGIMELAVTEQMLQPAPYTSWTIYRLDQNNNFTKLTAQTTWGNGDAIDTNEPYLFSQYPVNGITPVTWWIKATKYTSAVREQVIPVPQSGMHWFYRDTEGLKETTSGSPSIFVEYAVTSIVYGNAVTGEKVVFGNERHGIIMDGVTHMYNHVTEGTKYISGFGIFGLADGSGVYTQVDSGRLFDEDLDIITNIQIISPFWYVDTAVWRGVNDGLDLGYKTTGNVFYNYRNPSTGDWSLVEVANNDYMLIHIFATNDAEFPVVKILGQNYYATVPNAREAALSEIKSLYLVGLPAPEFVPLYTIILNESGELVTTDTGDLYIDWRTTSITATQGSGDILPSQAGNEGKFLYTNGSIPSWVEVPDPYINLDGGTSSVIFGPEDLVIDGGNYNGI